MIERNRDVADAFATFALLGSANFELKNHGLLSANKITADYVARKHAKKRLLRVTKAESILFNIPHGQPPEDLLMTLRFTHKTGSDEIVGPQIMKTGVAVFGNISDSKTCDPITRGPRVSHMIVAVERTVESYDIFADGSVVDGLAYSLGLVLPGNVLRAVQQSDWRYRDVTEATEDWESLTELAFATDPDPKLKLPN
ncbi:MAG TPA: hypothetical protein PJ984_00010 [Candidatus Saccharibacteria bacterium]|nr:hypothetical protein [Candidatus Saccharibacteria bacterium]